LAERLEKAIRSDRAGFLGRQLRAILGSAVVTVKPMTLLYRATSAVRHATLALYRGSDGLLGGGRERIDRGRRRHRKAPVIRLSNEPGARNCSELQLVLLGPTAPAPFQFGGMVTAE
jgi:hypothetical protein